MSESAIPTRIAKPGPQPVIEGRQAIIWLTLVSTIVFLTFVIVIYLLCNCSCRRRNRKVKERSESTIDKHQSTQILDNRNDYRAWNPSAPLRPEEDQDGFVLTPLTKAAVRPAGAEQHPGEPVVIEEAEEGEGSRRRTNAKGPGYYTSWSGRFSRISGIGRAY